MVHNNRTKSFASDLTILTEISHLNLDRTYSKAKLISN